MGGLTLGAALAATLPPGGLDCLFDTASIDGRTAFDSVLTARADPVPDAPHLAMLWVGNEPGRLALVQREGVWLSLRTATDIDHDNRVTVLDIAESGPNAGLAVLVVSQPGEPAAGIISREGRCTARAPQPS
jgi:hypothetical protein